MKIMAVAVVLASTLWLATGTLDPHAAIDEPAWISSASVTLRLARTLAPPSEWNNAYDRAELGDWGHRNPTLGKLIIGAGLLLSGQSEQSQLMWPDALPSFGALVAARLAITVCAGFTLWLAYLLAWQLTGSPFALAAPLFLLALPVFRFHATHVYTDMPEIMLMLAAACLLASRRLLLASVAVGLACAVKFNAAPMMLAVCGARLFASGDGPTTPADGNRKGSRVPGYQRHEINNQQRGEARFRLVHAGLRTALLGLIAFAVFVAVNPYLYPNPIGRSLHLMQEWRQQKVDQRQNALAASWAVRSRAEGLSLTAGAIVRPDAVQASVFGQLGVLGWLIAGLVVIGLSVMRSRLWWMIFGVNVLATVLWLPFDWGRYYLPVVLWLPPLIVLGFDQCHSLIANGRFSTRP